MPLPNELIEARDLARKASSLTISGYLAMAKKSPAKVETARAIAKMIESFSVVEKGFEDIQRSVELPAA